MTMDDLRIVFMGTPEFAVASLHALIEAGYEVCAVVTAPDRPAGRGQKLRISPVKDYALARQIPVLQPGNLKDPAFHEQLRSFDAGLFVVVAFRMLPEAVWKMPAFGTFNLHASLLPQYRGAAPINHAIINGERRGGVTTLFLQHEIDTGNIIMQRATTIGQDETAGEYHDRLMAIGAGLTVDTVKAIQDGQVNTLRQEDLMKPGEKLRTAPKIHKEDCRIDWNLPAIEVFNLIRGLSPYPGAFSEIELPGGRSIYLKIYRAAIIACDKDCLPGSLISDAGSYLYICCKDACLSLLEVQQAGKKRMPVKEFLIGLNLSNLS